MKVNFSFCVNNDNDLINYINKLSKDRKLSSMINDFLYNEYLKSKKITELKKEITLAEKEHNKRLNELNRNMDSARKQNEEYLYKHLKAIENHYKNSTPIENFDEYVSHLISKYSQIEDVDYEYAKKIVDKEIEKIKIKLMDLE